MDVEHGWIEALDTGDTGWLVGFGDWIRKSSSLRYMPADALAQGLQVKWMNHPAGDQGCLERSISRRPVLRSRKFGACAFRSAGLVCGAGQGCLSPMRKRCLQHYIKARRAPIGNLPAPHAHPMGELYGEGTYHAERQPHQDTDSLRGVRGDARTLSPGPPQPFPRILPPAQPLYAGLGTPQAAS
jgi:hypothetical protein